MSQKKIKQERKQLEEENARLQKKLVEQGAIFGGMENLSPEVMNQWLKNIVQVEEEDQKRKNN